MLNLLNSTKGRIRYNKGRAASTTTTTKNTFDFLKYVCVRRIIYAERSDTVPGTKLWLAISKPAWKQSKKKKKKKNPAKKKQKSFQN